MDTNEAPVDATEPKTPEQKPDGDFKSPESKAAVLADLHAEREARKELQKQVESLTGSVGILDELRKALAPQGSTPDPQADLAAQVADMRRQLDAAAAEKQQNQLAASVAAEIGVTNAADVALIAAQRDEGAMRSLADRLKGATPAGTPKPDPSAGHSGDPKPSTLAAAINQHYGT